MLINIVLILTLPRRKVILWFLIGCFCIPIQQVVVVGGVHFTVLRIIIIAGLLRRSMERKSPGFGKFGGGYNRVDQAVVLWTISELVILSVQWMDSQALIHNLGDFLDAIGGFLVVRFLITDRDSVVETVKALAVIFTIQGVC